MEKEFMMYNKAGICRKYRTVETAVSCTDFVAMFLVQLIEYVNDTSGLIILCHLVYYQTKENIVNESFRDKMIVQFVCEMPV